MTSRRKSSGPRRLGACLPEPLRAALSRRTDERARLDQAWGACVGEPLGTHVRPVRYAGGVLHVHVDTSAWAARLRHQQPALVAQLRRQTLFAGLAQIRARVVPAPDAAPVPGGAPQNEAPAAPSRLPAKAAEAVARTAASIDHPGLRAALERLAGVAAPRRPR